MNVNPPNAQVDEEEYTLLTDLASALIPESRTTDFTAALRRGTVSLQTCTACGASQAPPLPFCRACGSARLQTTDGRGTGRIVSTTRVHYRFHELTPEPPYTVVVIELDEGPRLFGLMDEGATAGLDERVRVAGPFDVFGPWFVPVGTDE